MLLNTQSNCHHGNTFVKFSLKNFKSAIQYYNKINQQLKKQHFWQTCIKSHVLLNSPINHSAGLPIISSAAFIKLPNDFPNHLSKICLVTSVANLSVIGISEVAGWLLQGLCEDSMFWVEISCIP